MKRGRPSLLGLSAPSALGSLGQITRSVGEGGRELYRLPSENAALAARLLALGSRRVAGFVDGGVDDDGPWLVRVAADRTLGAELKRERSAMAWPRAVRIALDVAEALSACEAEALDPGALTPDAVLIEHDRAFFAADALLDRELGIAARPSGSLSPIWCPPAQADGAPFDDGANRYVLGLLLYKMLTGTHPFSGAGLRRALEAAAQNEAPPFPHEIAESLPPGLQALTLRLLQPDAARRPPSSDAIADALSRFLGQGAGAGNLDAALVPTREARARETQPGGRAGETVPPTERTIPAEAAPLLRASAAAGPREAHPAQPKPARFASRSGSPWVRVLMPIALGAAVAAAAVTQLEPASKASRPLYDIDAPPALTAAETKASDCASCHARQVSEWRRSVMGHAVKSPLFNGLESLVEEQVGRDFDCPNGAGILRKTNAQSACTDPQSGLAVSGSGGEHWCVNCHSPNENLDAKMPVWQGRAGGDPKSLLPVRDILNERGMEGISCGFCHQVHGPVNPRSRGYQGNPSWTSFVTGQVFPSRPEDRSGLFGIANSGYQLDPSSFISARGDSDGLVPHKLQDEASSRYLRSSEFCGSCHDVRLFGTDVLGAQKGDRFKRLRNGYSEWVDWAAQERRKGRAPATCQDCHMSTFPGVCVPAKGAAGDDVCPDGTAFEKRAPGVYANGRVAQGSREPTPISSHYLSGVDLPLAREYPEDLLDEDALDIDGVPISAKARRNALLRAAFDFDLKDPIARGSRLSIPLTIENVGGGHRVPAGFSQEREIWVQLTVKDKAGRVIYEVGRVDRNDEDLHDKIFERVNTNPNQLDNRGRPVGMFGADVRDGADRPQWSPRPDLGGTRFTGKGLINFQNGFLRCVTCIGVVAADGTCQPGSGQGVFRADRFADGVYDIDTGSCSSNLSGQNALFETYFPVGALDSSRGLPKAPDAIVDTRSAPPGVPITYTFDLDTAGARGPFTIKARLLFRSFPPFLIRAFAEYERQMARLGRRPSGPLVDETMLKRIEIVEIAKDERTAP